MATKTLSLLLLTILISLLTITATARPCKTLFYFSATTTTTTYTLPNNPINSNPNNYNNPLFQNPRYFTLIFTSSSSTTNRHFLPRPRLQLNPNPNPNFDNQLSTSSNFPMKHLYSTSIRDRTKDIMSVVGALLFGVGCGALTAATMYFVWSLFSSAGRFDYDDVAFDSEDDDDDDDDVAAIKRKLKEYVPIPSKAVDVEEDVVKKEVV